MKKRLTFSGLIIGTLFNLNTMAANVSYSSLQEDHETGASVLSPEQEKAYLEEARRKGNYELLEFKFEQTDWRECTDVVTGNYSGYNCANRRGISVILKDFMDNFMPVCVQEALDEVGGGQLDQLHIIHDGILGDRRHSPRSMHAENRAIDIDSFVVTTYDGETKKYLYESSTNRDFFVAFRNCWGRIVHENNGCPYYADNPQRTGSIGWEDKDHQHHMHTSVPYCVNGSYGSYYYNR